jgi:hypothetical protein
MTVFRRVRAAGRRGALVASVFALVAIAVSGYFVNEALAAGKPAAPTITASPANPTLTAATAPAAFSFTDTQALVTFKCSIDGAAYALCVSPKTYPNLAQGNHTFSVEAFSGTTASNATSFSWAIVPPLPTINSHPANPTGSTTAAFAYSDAQSSVSFLCSIDGGGFNACPTAGVAYANLAGGLHSFSVEARHGVTPPSGPATFSWTIDRTAPTTTLAFPVNGQFYNAAAYGTGCAPAGICGTASDSSGVASVAVAVQQQSSAKYWSGTGFTASSPVFNAASGTTNWHYALARPADGPYRVLVRATDVFDNVTASSAYTSATLTIDSVAPAAPVLTEKPSNPTRDINPELEITDTSSPANFTCRLDSGSAVNCTSHTDHDGDAGEGHSKVQAEQQYAKLAPGNHCFSVFATDLAGNVGPTTTYCWTIVGTTTGLTITVSSGSAQTATPGSAFGVALVAKLTNSANNPIPNTSVTFTAPASGASGTFASPCSGRTCVVTTNASGLATAPTFAANNTSGGYTVTATAPGAAAAANFALFDSMSFAISGNISTPLSPGSSQSMNLLVTNPNPAIMTIPAGGISLTIDTGNAACSAFGTAPANFTFTSVGAAVTVPANITTPVSLTSLGVPTNKLPVLKMNNTAVNQNACKHLNLTLRYTGSGSGS